MSIYKERPKGEYRNYWLQNPIDFKIYTGYCKGKVEDRWKNGKGYPNNPELQADIDVIGFDNFLKGTFRADCDGLPIEFAADMYEPWWIEKLDCMWPNGYNKNSGGRRGYHLCQDTKDKISAALSKAVDQIDPETGAVVASFPSRTAASKATGISLTGISEAARGIQKTAGGYRWEEKK